MNVKTLNSKVQALPLGHELFEGELYPVGHCVPIT